MESIHYCVLMGDINMKYIRTKDGRIWKVLSGVPNKDDWYEQEDGIICLPKKKILKTADTIEELCDGFWWEDSFYKAPIFMPNYHFVLDRVQSWKESDKELSTNEFDRISIYASIYVKAKGWVHVAKMNNKGCLELL